MKETSKDTKTTSTVSAKPAAGPEGASIAPPAYGIEHLDGAAMPVNAAPLQMQAGLSTGDASGKPTANHTYQPDSFKTGLEALSSMSMDAVRMHTKHQALAIQKLHDVPPAVIQRKYSGRQYPNPAGRPDLAGKVKKTPVELRALFAEITEGDVQIYDQVQNIYEHGEKAARELRIAEAEDKKDVKRTVSESARVVEIKAVADAFQKFKTEDTVKGRIGMTDEDAARVLPHLFDLCNKLNTLEEGEFKRAQVAANRAYNLDDVINARNVYGLTLSYTKTYTGQDSKAHAPHGSNFNRDRTIKQILDNIIAAVTTISQQDKVETNMQKTWKDYKR